MSASEVSQSTRKPLASKPLISFSIDDANEDLEDKGVRIHRAADFEQPLSYGVLYQKCGGGRRVIRKRIGGN
jgi:hypothetical protein